MKRLMPIFIVILLSGCGILTAYAPNMLSMIVVAVMGVVVLLGIIYGLIPVLTFTQGLLTGQKSIQRASEAEEKSVWITALQMDRFFRQKKMDQLFREYRDKVKQQRQNGQIVSDLEDILNEDRSWICWTVCQRKMIIQFPVWGQLQTQPLEMSVF